MQHVILAQEGHGFATIGLGGVWNWRSGGVPISDLDRITWQGRQVFIVFDSPDVNINQLVTSALEHLAAELRRRGANVRIGVLPAAEGKKVGLDDFLVANSAAALQQILDEAKQFLDPISELNAQFATVWFGAKLMVMREARRADGSMDVDFAKPADVKPAFAGRYMSVHDGESMRRVNVFEHWLRSPRHRHYERVVFAPGSSLENEYNLWRGFSVQPKPGDCSLYLNHVRDNICSGDAQLFQYVLAWMAHAVQRPGELPGTALVFRGRQGTGKSIFAQTFGELFGSHFLHMSQSRQLLGNFNAHTKDKLVLYADEAFWAGDKAGEGALKALITEPTRIVEYKGRDALIVSNFTRLIITSNHEWVVPAGPEERRFAVIDVGDAQIQNSDYFGRIKVQMDRTGLAALLDHLLKFDLSTVDLRRIPRTAALLDNKLSTLPQAQRFWYECLMAGDNCSGNGVWETEVQSDLLHHRYLEHAKQLGLSWRAAQTELGVALKHLVPGMTAVRRRSESLRGAQKQHWLFPPLDACRASFCAAVGQAVDWGDSVDHGKAQKGKSKGAGPLGQLGSTRAPPGNPKRSRPSKPSRPFPKSK